MTTPADLPVNIDTTYADTGAADVKAHQQHHDTVHAFVKAQAPVTKGTVAGQVPVWDGDSFEPTTPTDATATDVPFTPTGGIAATSVQAAIAELDTEKAATGHTHPSTAADISFSPTGTVAATTVQAAIAEVASEAGVPRPAASVNFNGQADLVVTNAAAAETEINVVASFTGIRMLLDLSNATEFRLLVTVRTLGSTGTVLYPKYRTLIDGNAPTDYLDAAAGPQLSIASQGFRDSGWQTLTPAARTLVIISWFTAGGDAVADPRITHIVMQYR